MLVSAADRGVGQTKRYENHDIDPPRGGRLRWITRSTGTVVRVAVTRLAAALILLLLTVPLGTAAAQSSEKMPRIGYLSPGFATDPMRERFLEAFRQGLRELGYVEGQNIVLEPRWAEGKYDRLPALAADLVRSKVDVIVVDGGAAAQAARQATRTIPIVMSAVVDPVGSALVPSLARPGGNLTGTSVMATDLIGKQFELLRGVVPKVPRMALLWNPANPSHATVISHGKDAARSLGVQLQLLEARDPQEIDRAFAAMSDVPGANLGARPPQQLCAA